MINSGGVTFGVTLTAIGTQVRKIRIHLFGPIYEPYDVQGRERKNREREEQRTKKGLFRVRMTSGHKSLADLKMTSYKALHGLQKYSGSCYQQTLRGQKSGMLSSPRTP